MHSLAVLLALAPTMTLSQGHQAPLRNEGSAPVDPGTLGRSISNQEPADFVIEDGGRCSLESGTCDKCRNPATMWWTKGYVACGQEKKLERGTKCFPTTTCKACEGSWEYWPKLWSTACGKLKTPRPTPEPTAAPTEQPTPAPTASPTPAPTRAKLKLDADCWHAGATPAARDHQCEGDLLCARVGVDGRHFGCLLKHCCTKLPTKPDGQKCWIGIDCHKCKNEATWWRSKFSMACGKEPTPMPTPAPTPLPTPSPTPSPTPAPTPTKLKLDADCWHAGATPAARDHQCEGDLVCSRVGHDERHFGCLTMHCCTELPTKPDGTICYVGVDCHKCQNEASVWHSKTMHFACGSEPKWPNGTTCELGLNCIRCHEPATWWKSRGGYACGTQQ